MRRYTRRHVGGSREQLIYKTHYTSVYYDKVAKMARKMTDRYLLNKLVLQILGKSQDGRGIAIDQELKSTM